jgi:ferredoxin
MTNGLRGGAALRYNVDRPTYEIVGELSRFDERDTVFARERLVDGSPEERAYHAAHPELVEIDRRIAAFIEAVDRPEESGSPAEAALYRATFDPIAGLGLPDVVDGELPSTRVEADPTRMAARIKVLARRLGADDVRIGPLNPAWVYSHRGTPPFFARPGRPYQPNPPHFSGLPEGYRGQRWGDPIEVRHSYIRALGWPARAHHLRNYGVAVVPVAVDAGLGELGRCGYLLHPRLGANLRLACVTTDLPLALDPPVDLGVQDFCAKCLKCAVNCPPGAIPSGDKVAVRGVRKWQIDPVKCLLYWGHLGSACSICQTVCPWSKPPTLPHRIVARIAFRVPPARRFLVWADDLVYGARFRPARPPGWWR